MVNKFVFLGHGHGQHVGHGHYVLYDKVGQGKHVYNLKYVMVNIV